MARRNSAEASSRTIYLPPWRIDVERRSGVESPSTMSELARTAATALSGAGAPSPSSLGLILTDDQELTALNATHMGEVGPTDVLSFPLLQPSDFPPHTGQDAAARAESAEHREPAFAAPPGRRQHVGDIVISAERAAAQASEGRGGQTGDVAWSAADEMRLLVIHGVLHICGWDHAIDEERGAMRTLESRLLENS